jgi:hypothetical protein
LKSEPTISGNAALPLGAGERRLPRLLEPFSNPSLLRTKAWSDMPRDRQRVPLESGPKLDLNRLAQQGYIRRGAHSRSRITWTENFCGEEVASGIITADMTDEFGGWFRIEMDDLVQTIRLVSEPRHFGGRQWYFRCPQTNRKVSVLWLPPGAESFACRQRWGRQVAYSSQFADAVGRAHIGKDRINSRICRAGSFNVRDWDFPPKPKWMRWETYNRAEGKFDRYEKVLDFGTYALVARLMAKEAG